MNGDDADARLAQPNDVIGLARHVPEFDPARYVDEQAWRAYADALDQWPVLARLMGLKKD